MSLVSYYQPIIAATGGPARDREVSLVSLLFAVFIAVIVGLSFAAWHDLVSAWRRAVS